MPLFMDIHKHIPGLTKEGVEGAHAADLAAQGKHNVNYVKYWYNDKSGEVFCLIDAPSKEAAIQVHREAHGLLADTLVEVTEGR
jgi:hypothetical protein